MAAESDGDGDDEWNPSASPQESGVAPEDQDRFRGLLTELLFSGAGAPVLLASAAWLPDIYDLSAMDGVRVWLPLVLGALGFGCLVWLVTVILRLTRVRRSGGGE
jgi:hypothetical protein